MFSASTGKGLKSPGMFDLDRKHISGAEGKAHRGMQKAGKHPEKFKMQVYDCVRTKKKSRGNCSESYILFSCYTNAVTESPSQLSLGHTLMCAGV